MIKPFPSEHIEQLDKLQALWTQQCDLERENMTCAGGVQWKPVKGRDYLIHYFTDPATGKRRFESRGPRSPKTEAWRESFLRRRADLDRAAERLQAQQQTAAAIAKGLKIGRMPVASGNIFRALSRSELRNDAVLTGSFSLLAYEAQARASIPTELLSMPDQRIDLDFFLSDASTADAFERVLRSADSSFRRAGHGSRRFENKAGMIVDCFTRQDLAEIGEQIYGGREDVADAFLAASSSEPVDGLVVDRSGMIAPVRILTLQNFLTLKSIRATFDPMRSEDERRLDGKQVEAMKEIAGWLGLEVHDPIAEGDLTEGDNFDGDRYPGM